DDEEEGRRAGRGDACGRGGREAARPREARTGGGFGGIGRFPRGESGGEEACSQERAGGEEGCAQEEGRRRDTRGRRRRRRDALRGADTRTCRRSAPRGAPRRGACG